MTTFKLPSNPAELKTAFTEVRKEIEAADVAKKMAYAKLAALQQLCEHPIGSRRSNGDSRDLMVVCDACGKTL